MLLTKYIMVKWNPRNKKHYVNLGYNYTKMGDEFEAKIEHLMNGSKYKIDVKCDNCNKIIKNIQWYDYVTCVKENEIYYCRKCSNKIYGIKKYRKTRLKNSISFEQWCIENNNQDILNRWDYKLNNYKPSEITYGTSSKYYFKCPKGIHKSELKKISSITYQTTNIKCNQCECIAEKYPYLVKYFKNKEDTKNYSSFTKTKVEMKCPDCGYERKRKILLLSTGGFSCPRCGDGFSYPNKFMFNLLQQLKDKKIINNFKNEKSFVWSKNKRYDFYIQDFNMIIEMHGGQHYEEIMGKLSDLFKKNKDNDKLKYNLAIKNNIKNYIIIDCKYSNLEHIKNNIIQSKLPKLLNFEENNIDWMACYEYVYNNLVKEVCNLWNDGIKDTNQIAKKLNLGSSTVVRYLKQGNKMEWCNYDPKKQRHKRKVICLNTNEIFNKIIDAKNKYNSYSISDCCREKVNSSGKHPRTGEGLVWAYYEDYLKMTNNEIKNKLKKVESLKNNKRKPVKVYEKDTDRYIGEYNSLTECGKMLNIDCNKLTKYFNHKIDNINGYIFKSID